MSSNILPVSGLAPGQTEANTAREIAEAMRETRKVEEGVSGADVMRGGANTGLGGRITLSLVRGLDAKLDVNSATQGTTVTVDIPAED